MTDVVEAYARPSLAAVTRWDEMVDPDLGVRAPWRGVGELLRGLGPAGLARQRQAAADMLAQQGVTYRPHGAARERPWALDTVPLVLDAGQWARLEPALAQRARLLDLLLTDLYGPRRVLAEGLVPPEVVLGHPGFVRQVDGVRLPAAHQLFLTATDLARGPDGTWTVVSDRTQAPSGAGYAMADRQIVSRVLPGPFRDTGVARLSPFFAAVRLALQALAPADAEIPRIVLLTPGTGSETAYDQAALASLLGFPLVEGGDLVVRDGHVWQLSVGRRERVDVIVRRLDADWCDPLDLRPDSQLGVPGLVEACRLGTVSVVNGLGAGVLENPGLLPYLPGLSRALLDEPLLLPSAPTWWCGDDTGRRHVLAHLDELVIRPVARSAGSASRFGWQLSADALDRLARRIEAEPGAWVGQQPVDTSTAPTLGAGGLEARPVTLRTFAVAEAAGYRVMPGGLARVGSDPADRVVTGLGGASAKDVWVLTPTTAPAREQLVTSPRGRVGAALSPRMAGTLFWLGRYAERAEDVSRVVQVVDTLWRDVHAGADPSVRTAVDVLLGAAVDITSPQPPLDGATEPVHRRLFALIGDRTRTGTVVHDVRRVVELAVASRDQLSLDTWTVLGGLDDVLAPFDPAPGGTGSWIDRDVAAAMGRLRVALTGFAGLAQESLVRDTGWHFLDAGRRLERAVQVVRLLDATLERAHGAADEVVQEQVLVAADSIITHRRRYPARSGVATVLELVLRDADNPRSLAYQLASLAAHLKRIPDASPRAVDLVHALGADVDRLDPAELARVDDGRRAVLSDFLSAAGAQLHAVAAALGSAHFGARGALRRLGDGPTVRADGVAP